ncbi:MAG: hypothetical protein IT168_04735 [Bryobacterales bacterium]|nr:hypothetical protein [Bryobacterales bacterium]
MTRRSALSALLTAPAAHAQVTTARLSPETVRAFDEYVRKREQEIAGRGRRRNFLWIAEQREGLNAAKDGAFVKPYAAGATTKAADGLIHDWVGAVYIPAPLTRVLAFVKNYARHQDFYKPEVLQSRILANQGDDFRVFLRLQKSKVITVVLDTEYDIRYTRVDANRVSSRSISTRIAEVADPGTDKERVLSPGDDHGFLWRLNSYWRFAEQDGATVMECEAVSLSRSVPMLLSPVVTPIVRALPEESLKRTLDLTRKHVTLLPTPSGSVSDPAGAPNHPKRNLD